MIRPLSWSSRYVTSGPDATLAITKHYFPDLARSWQAVRDAALMFGEFLSTLNRNSPNIDRMVA
jgi:hypothetical protein